MITANFIHRTFRIRCGTSIGAAFTIDIDGRHYLVTARHVIANHFQEGALHVFGNGQWLPLSATLVGHAPNTIDVSVLAPERRLSPPALPVNTSSGGLTYGQDVYFLGFPYYFLGNVIFTEEGFPLPFVKRALMSCFAGDVYLLDGHNNPGFSGGPVLFGPPGIPPTNIAAVISGYKFVPEPIFEGQAQTELTYRYNTGIIVAYKVEHALALIRANPIGIPE
jgi:hypothetical protein